MHNLKRLLKNIPGGYDVDLFLRSPMQEVQNWLDCFTLKRRFCDSNITKSSGKLLVVSLQGNFVAAAKQEILLVKAAQFAGLKPVILTNRWAWENRFYRAFGIKSFVYFEDFLRLANKKIDNNEIIKSADSIKSFDELMRFSYKGVNIGKYICSSLVRKTYSGAVDVTDLKTKELIRRYFIDASINAIAATDIYDAYKPDSVLFLERGYTPYGEFFDIALKQNLNVVQWCGSHKNSSLTLKRYNAKNKDQHPASLSQKTWDVFRNLKWDKAKADAIKQELFRNYSSGEWFSEVGTQFNSKIVKSDEVKKSLGLDLGKKTAVIFPHLFWDATFFWGKDIFTNYREWFVEAVKAACKNTNVNWVLKFHPANIVKLARDKYKGELIERISIKESIGELPPHIKNLEPNTPISTYSLFSVMDYCLTVRGTIGIESAVFGIPVFTAGTGRYDGHGFTIDSSSKEDYLAKLSKIHTYPRLTSQQIELAQKFAYGTFIARPFDLKSINISYKRDKKATSNVEYTVKNVEELKNMVDVRAFGDWIANSKDEDFVDVSKM